MKTPQQIIELLEKSRFRYRANPLILQARAKWLFLSLFLSIIQYKQYIKGDEIVRACILQQVQSAKEKG